MTRLAAPELPTVRIVDQALEWDELASDWAELFEASSQAATPLQFDWLRTWWRVYGQSGTTDHQAADGRGEGLRIITFWRRSRLVGVLPLYETRVATLFSSRRLSFLSTGEAEHEETCPDYLNLLAAPMEEGACIAALETALATIDWDCVRLLGVPEHSPLLRAGIRSDRRSLAISPSEVCPVANLDGGFETYLGRLSSNARERSRRLLREAAKAGADFDLATPATFELFFDDLIRLHQQRWIAQRKPGCFGAARFTEFHRSLGSQWIGRGRSVLARLSLEGHAVAVLYGFTTRSKFDFYQSGIETSHRALRSPGRVAHLLLMRELAARGVKRYDFLRGSSRYKAELATETAQLYTVEVWRSAMRASASHVVERVRRAAGRALPKDIRRRLRAR